MKSEDLPDIIIKGGKAFLPDGRFHKGLCITVKDGKFKYIGECGDYEKNAGAGTKVINAEGMTILPGLKDSHLHLLSFGLALSQVNLKGCRSISEVKSMIREFIKQNNIKENQWILGRGWDQNIFEEKRVLSREDLDDAAPYNPVLMTRICCHAACLNTMAIKKLNFHEGMPDPEGGKIDRRNDGSLSGLIFEEGAVNLVRKGFSKPTAQEIENALKKAIDYAVSRGITGVHSDDLGYSGGFENCIRAYENLERKGELKFPVYLELIVNTYQELVDVIKCVEACHNKSKYIRIGPIKIVLDGTLGIRTAAMLEPYNDESGEKGILNIPEPELNDMISLAHRKGFQIAVHVIGDRAAKAAIDAFEKAQNEYEREDARHRLVHCQFMKEELLEKMKASGILGDIQPRFVPSDYAIVVQRVGEERARYSYAWKTMKDMGIRISGGSDCPIELLDPLLGMHSAIFRTDLDGNPEGGWHSSESLSISDAVELFSKDVCFAEFSENEKGTIESGKAADLTIINGDIEKDTFNVLKENDVKYTICSGIITYEK